MAERKGKKLLEKVDVEPEIKGEIAFEAVKRRIFKYEVVALAMKALRTWIGDSPGTHSDTSNSPAKELFTQDKTHGTIPHKLADVEAAEKGNRVPGTWEHQHLDDILKSRHTVAKRAIRENLVAFRELATGEHGHELPGDSIAGSEPLSGEQVEEVHRSIEDAERLSERAETARPQHPRGKGRRKTPPTGTSDRHG